MPFRYAAFSVMMPEFTIAESAALLKSLGYEGVEWRVHHVPKSDLAKTGFWSDNKSTIDLETILDQANEVRRISQENNLEIVCLGAYLGYKHLEEIERCMKAAKQMGCPCVRVSPPKYDGSINYHDLYEDAVDGFNRVEDLARTYCVRAVIELHRGNICSSASLAYKFVSNFDPDYVGVILDPGNMICEGYENWQLGLEMLGPYLSHVHVKNTGVAKGDSLNGSWTWYTVSAPLNEGLVYWPEVLRALDAVGFGGWLSVEDFSAGETKAKLCKDIDYLKSISLAVPRLV
jgi:sugar phosphate isomerase/epimerase